MHDKAVAKARVLLHQILRFLLVELQHNVVAHNEQDQFPNQQEHLLGALVWWWPIVMKSAFSMMSRTAAYCPNLGGYFVDRSSGIICSFPQLYLFLKSLFDARIFISICKGFIEMDQSDVK